MINSIEQKKRINRFQDVRIPSARDLYCRYGERLGKGEYTTNGSTFADPAIVNSGSVIDQMITAQNHALPFDDPEALSNAR